MKARGILAVVFAAVFLFSGLISAQDENKGTRKSPKAGVSQMVGTTNVSVSYSRPGVKGREIWGKLVPYDKVWRAGADEATAVTFDKDVKFNGKKVGAGTYSFFVIPTENEWTVILNTVAEQWGAYSYDESKDLLRFTVKPEAADHTEWLQYTIDKTGDYSADLSMRWEKLKLTVKVEAE